MQKNILVISDLHIGNGFKLFTDGTFHKPHEKGHDKLVSFLNHYIENKIDDSPWRLIINGDMFDFMSIVVYNKNGLLPDEDEIYGIDNTYEKSIIKLEYIFHHYKDIFYALAKFGLTNKIEIIAGNHDLELLYSKVQETFTRLMCECVNFDISNNIQIHSWFYYESDFIYASHGHSFDEYCSIDYEFSLLDDKVHQTVGHLGMRYFVNKMPHYDPYNAEEWGFFDYIKWMYRLGVKKTVSSLIHYGILVYKTFLLWSKLRITEKARKVENDKELFIHSLASNVPFGNIKKLYALSRPPVTRHLLKIAGTYFIDRILISAIGITSAILFAIYLDHHWKIIAPLAVLASIYLLNNIFNKLRFDSPGHIKLRSSAKNIVKLMPAKVVIFGHSHLPEVSPIGNNSTYINSGTWVEAGKCTYILLTKDGHELKYWE